MEASRRFHPFMMVFEMGRLIKNSLFFFVFLFIIKGGSDSWMFFYGRYALVGLFIFSLISIPIKWKSRTYTLEEKTLQITRRYLTTTKQTVPYSKVQHVKRKNTWLHRMFRVTSLTLETSVQGEESSIKFPALDVSEADKIERKIEHKKGEQPSSEFHPPASESAEEGMNVLGETTKIDTDEVDGEKVDRAVHFTSSKKEIIKASFTSFSFLAIIPLGASLLSKMEDFHWESKTEGVLSTILDSVLLTVFAVTVFILAAVVLGIGRTIVKYGKYEIASDPDKIYITKGFVDESYFSITKEKVQAVLIEQTFMKRLMGLAGVKLICAGGSEEDTDVSSLYPFLSVDRAHLLIEELLPGYKVQGHMERLPKQAFWVRLLRVSWLGIISTVILFFVKPDPFGFESFWVMASVLLFVFIGVSRILNYYHSKYVMDESAIQFQFGGFTSHLFLTKREKLLEVMVSRNLFQKKLGLASVNMVNRENPVRHTSMDDVPNAWASEFYEWYRKRENKIRGENKRRAL
ncbi:putative membrane protein [Halobacillus karajensis]|uniref:PH domain-containing protein n=1 Tax=Halobacillus karajensis TaxID=195088 RepID=UPI0008A7A4EF|nr:PH domain-containing protein [Halobacillus karajensis]SEI11789.1 putative membrane protein [Halobacillus karajensis]